MVKSSTFIYIAKSQYGTILTRVARALSDQPGMKVEIKTKATAVYWNSENYTFPLVNVFMKLYFACLELIKIIEFLLKYRFICVIKQLT